MGSTTLPWPPEDRPASSPSSRNPRSVGPFRVGQRVGGTYEVTRVLGAGGMGVVYEARDLALLRTVAIKAPLFAAFAHSLRAEAQALAAIRHPSFVGVHHVGQEDGIDFMVMERLYGETLETRIDEARLCGHHIPVQEVLEVLVAIADALSAAHGAGVAQRDLKPANVILCGARVVLVDLGLVVPEVLVETDADAAGSVEYVAPEVLLHDVKPGKGHLVDLYAFGILAYEMLMNETPFAGESIGLMLASHVGAPIPDVAARRRDVPGDLAALVTELLAKDPRARPPSAEAVLWQLKDIQSHGVRRARRMTVLVVDDEPYVGRSLQRTLESTFPQVHVETTTDPALVMALTPATHADVVLVDLAMPEHNGVEVCMSLLAMPQAERPAVVAMSAQANAEDVAVLRALGVRHFVPKDDDFAVAMSEVIRELRSGLPVA